MVGQHKVAVILRAMVGSESISLIDEKYSKPETSGITFTIDGPTDKLEINLQGPLKQIATRRAGASLSGSKHHVALIKRGNCVGFCLG